jgi:hypothetical protein
LDGEDYTGARATIEWRKIALADPARWVIFFCHWFVGSLMAKARGQSNVARWIKDGSHFSTPIPIVSPARVSSLVFP